MRILHVDHVCSVCNVMLSMLYIPMDLSVAILVVLILLLSLIVETNLLNQHIMHDSAILHIILIKSKEKFFQLFFFCISIYSNPFLFVFAVLFVSLSQAYT